MKARTLTHQITGRMVLPSGIAFLTMLVIPLALFLIPTGRHLFPQLGLDYYIILGMMTMMFIASYLIAERTR